MASSIKELEKLPAIDLLSDFGITLQKITEDMISDYQEKYEELTKEECVLYPAHPRRLELQVVAGQIYQNYEYMNYMFKQNFLPYMTDSVLWNWGANLGFAGSNLRAAVCMMEFALAEAVDHEVVIPEGSRVTAGDGVFFATSERAVIFPGELSVCVEAVCTVSGSAGNGYVAGQINSMVDLVGYVSSVKNITASAGGRDEYSGDTLREKIFLFPSTYSAAGPEDAYVYHTCAYSDEIRAAKVITEEGSSVVRIYILLQNGCLPDEAFCQGVCDYLYELKAFPDTDRIEVYPAEAVRYSIEATYYIDKGNREMEAGIMATAQEVAAAFADTTCSDMGISVNPDMFKEYARVAGIVRTEIASPQYQRIERHQVALCDGVVLHYGGLEG